jgi:hypothetical protein
VIHLFNGTESGIAAPDALTDSNMDLRLAEFPIQIKTDISQIRNKVYVRGSGNPKSTGYLPPVGQPQGDPGGADPWVWTINGSWMALQETGGNIDTNRNTPGLTWYWSASYIFVWTTATGRSFATWTSRYPCPVPLTNPYSVGYITGSNQVGLSVIYTASTRESRASRSTARSSVQGRTRCNAARMATRISTRRIRIAVTVRSS